MTNVYRNINVTNSITVVNHTTFVTGRSSPVDRNVVVNVREDFARRRNIVVGRPAIKPVETSYVPVVRQIPEAKRPPTAVRKIDVKELRQSRPLVKEPDRSVIRPQAKPRPLEVKKVEKPRSLSERTRERRQVAPPERGRHQETAPAERGKVRESPPERGKMKEASPEKGKSEGVPPDNVLRENLRDRTEREGEKGRR